MKNLARTFLKIGKILTIISIAICAFFFGLFLILTVTGFEMTDIEEEFEEAGIVVGSIGVVFTVFFGIMLALSIVSIALNKAAYRGLNNAKTKKQLIGPAIMAIISGMLFAELPIVSGILMLVMKENQINNNVVDVE